MVIYLLTVCEHGICSWTTRFIVDGRGVPATTMNDNGMEPVGLLLLTLFKGPYYLYDKVGKGVYIACSLAFWPMTKRRVVFY